MSHLRSSLRLIRAIISLGILAVALIAFLPESLVTTSLSWLWQGLFGIQLVPAFRGSLVGVPFSLLSLVVLLILPLLLGRQYCSVICPFGLMQEWVWRMRSQSKRRRSGAKASRNWRWLRYGILGLVVVCTTLGFALPLLALDPYSLFGRLISLATAFRAEDSFHLGASIGAAVIPLALVVLAFWKGRFFCNQLCPVGTLLSLLSRISLFRVGLDRSNCVKCGHCLSRCSARCIDLKRGKIEQSRCVSCLECYSVCPHHGIRVEWSLPWSKSTAPTFHSAPYTDSFEYKNTRRHFLGLVLAGVSLNGLDGEKEDGARLFTDVVTPPGSQGRDRLLSACVGCQLCLTQCPTGVLKPALFEYGLSGVLAPVMHFGTASCQYDCKRCSEVCPTGAILPLSLVDKQHTRVGIPVRDFQLCSAHCGEGTCAECIDACPVGAWKYSNKNAPTWEESCCTQCMSCVSTCPTEAVTSSREGDRVIIHVNSEACIGCGRCVQHCEGGALEIGSAREKLALPRMNGNKCVGCGACVVSCSAHALKMRGVKKHERAF